MKFKEFIQNEIILPRLRSKGVLVVYDPERIYRELCMELASDTRKVIDAGENSITSREEALKTLIELGAPDTKMEGMIVYVPAKAPLSDEEKQRDPFALYAACGELFPHPQKDGEKYHELCKKFKSDYITEINKIFSDNPIPDFSVIDAVGDGSGWPNLQALLGLESARDILFALLAPNEKQKRCLLEQDTWVQEVKELLAICLGLKLVTKSKKWEDISEELWRFLLFSEFVFDLRGDLPEALANIPRAKEEARFLVEDLCDQLRNDRRVQNLYIEKAEAIEKVLNLPECCREIKDFGNRDTFPFEERSFFHLAVAALKQDNTDAVRDILKKQRNSIWSGKGESQARWSLVEAALDLCEKCYDNERLLPEHTRSMEQLIDFYLHSLREVDRCQREFEQAAADCLDVQEITDEVVKQARDCYRRLMSKVHDLFLRHLEKTGWPVTGRLANADVFDKYIASKLEQSGYRVAFFLVDALRYELGVELEKQLAGDGRVEIQAALAQLPTITSVGMASLLPEAGSSLSLINQDDSVLPLLGETRLANVNQRMDVLREKYGQRFAEIPLGQLLARGQKDIPETVDLLVLRSADIDNQLETTPDSAFHVVYDTLKKVRAAVNKLKNLGFQEVIIGTDHGFCLNIHAEAGDVCAKPPGTWLNVHDRLLLGSGVGDNANLVMPADQLGIRGDFAQAAVPRSLVPYRAGTLYFHGGASLQECIVPILTVYIEKEQVKIGTPAIVLSYKSGAKRITTRFPVVEIRLEAGDLYSTVGEYEILLEAHDRKGNVVGEAKPGGLVNPVTGTITLKPGEAVQIPLKMQLDFEGKFIVKAMDPVTLAGYSQIELETDYVDGV